MTIAAGARPLPGRRSTIARQAPGRDTPVDRPHFPAGTVCPVRAVVQRVTAAAVRVDGEVVAAVELDAGAQGLVALIGVTHTDTAADQGAPILVISQFTLYANTAKGRRPSWNAAAPAAVAEPLVDAVVAALRARGATVCTGRFGANMAVSLVNDGPVTLVLDTA